MSRSSRLADPAVAHHYRVETGLARRLLQSTRAERASLYTDLYEQLFREVPWHSQLSARDRTEERELAIRELLDTLRPYLEPDTEFAQIGPRDCVFTARVPRMVRKAWAIDVSPTVMASAAQSAPNLEPVLSDGVSVPVRATLVFSNQLMEHLHPDDAMEQLRNIHAALSPGGMYLCITPNRLNGPHDVSRGIDEVAHGFHLREYSYADLVAAFHRAGFARLRALVRVRGLQFEVPPWALCALERLVEALPRPLSRRVAGMPVLRRVLEVRLIGIRD
nr:MAG: class I SAM-dependent methyltransferase [Pseudomonadota bacterium]